MVTIQFCGGAQSVTGANYLVDNGQVKFVVDCGLVQGSREASEENYEEFVYQPSEVDFMVATHAHIDHIGRIPKLVKDGFRGEIYSTQPTKDFAAVSLMDTVKIMSYDTEVEPLFGEEDVQRSVKQWQGKEYGEIFELGPDVSFRFMDAGHILGSAITEMWILDPETGKRIKVVFSGDMGNAPSVLLKKYDYITEADYILVESCYGDRVHEQVDGRKDILRQAVKDTIDRKGVLLVPMFSIERTQDILYELNDIVENHSGEGKKLGRVGKIDVYLDSPLGIKATEIHERYPQYYNEDAKKLSKTDNVFEFPFFSMTPSRDESMKINTAPNPKMIMAGSGMSTGGRILHHESRYLSDPNNILLFVGYQAPNTLGRKIQEGENPVYIHGHPIENKIETRRVGGYSAHADQNMLIDWLSEFINVTEVFVVQGEEEAAQALADRASKELSMKATVPTENQIIHLK